MPMGNEVLQNIGIILNFSLHGLYNLEEKIESSLYVDAYIDDLFAEIKYVYFFQR